MIALLLIDTRDHRPEDQPDRPRGTVLDVLLDVVRWMYPWPAAILWLFIGGVVLHGVVGMCFAVGALLVSFWRLSRVYPTWGISDHKQ